MNAALLVLPLALLASGPEGPVTLPTPAPSPTPVPGAVKPKNPLSEAAAKIKVNRGVDLDVKPGAPASRPGSASPGMPGYSADVVAQIESDCSRQWGSDVARGRECVGAQVLAAAKIKTEPPAGIPDDVNRRFLADCAKDWGRDWVKVRGCQEQRADAWRASQR